MTATEFRRMALGLPEAKKAAVREALKTAWRNRAPGRIT
jgi:hypothetical protein